MNPWGLPLSALVAALIGAGIAVGVMLWEPWGSDDETLVLASPVPSSGATTSPQPTVSPYQPRLTAAEAGPLFENNMGFVNSALVTDFSNKIIAGDVGSSLGGDNLYVYEVEDCQTLDYNEVKQAWVIECTEVWLEVQPRPGEFPNVWRGEISRESETYLFFDATEQMTDIDGDEVPYGAWRLRE